MLRRNEAWWEWIPERAYHLSAQSMPGMYLCSLWCQLQVWELTWRCVVEAEDYFELIINLDADGRNGNM